MSGGRHKVFGHPALHIIPQTSTIGSHLPRAVGLAFALDSRRDGRASGRRGRRTPSCVCSFGDASANHSTATGALNAAAYLAHRDLPLPLLFVCEDNGIGISTRVAARAGRRARSAAARARATSQADGADPEALLAVGRGGAGRRPRSRRPGVLHLRTVRLMGHAGSDAEIAYRSRAEIAADYERDPLLATARVLVDARRR